MVEQRAKSSRPLGCSPGSRRMRSSEYPLMAADGDELAHGHRVAAGAVDDGEEQAGVSGSNIRPSIIEKPRSCRPGGCGS